MSPLHIAVKMLSYKEVEFILKNIIKPRDDLLDNISDRLDSINKPISYLDNNVFKFKFDNIKSYDKSYIFDVYNFGVWENNFSIKYIEYLKYKEPELLS
jgi:hypothetical protein